MDGFVGSFGVKIGSTVHHYCDAAEQIVDIELDEGVVFQTVIEPWFYEGKVIDIFDGCATVQFGDAIALYDCDDLLLTITEFGTEVYEPRVNA